MQIQGHTIPEGVLEAGVARMKVAPFRSAEVAKVIGDALDKSLREIPHIEDKIADRLIQREKKAGNIELGGKPRRWTWTANVGPTVEEQIRQRMAELAAEDEGDEDEVTCEWCGHVQPDMGRGVACEGCGERIS
jgi:hypothetical protein